MNSNKQKQCGEHKQRPKNHNGAPPNKDNTHSGSLSSDAIQESTNFWRKGDIIVLHHHTLRNRRLKITLDLEASIGKCKRSSMQCGSGVKQSVWIVPCDMTGLGDDVVSGVKPQKRPIRIRIHPETLYLAESNKELARSIDISAKQLIEGLLGADWSLSAPSLPDVRLHHIQQLRKLFATAKAQITHFSDCVVVNWPFDKSHVVGTLSRSSSVLGALSLKVSSRSLPDTKQPICDQAQIVSLRFIRESICEPLFNLYFTDLRQPKWLTTDRKDHIVELDERGFRLRLRRNEFEVDSVPIRTCESVSAVRFEENGDEKQMMLVDSQKHVEELRRRLDESLSLFQRQQKLSGIGTTGQSNDKHRRILTVLYQDEQQIVIQVSGPPPISCPVGSLEGKTCRKIQTGTASSPLQVIVGASAGQSGLPSDSLPSSPASSVDSGVSSLGSSSSSPSASPGSSPVYVRGSPFHQNSENGIANELGVRQRSTSECATWTGLKSILKKTTPIVVYKGRLSRSISECRHPDEKEAIDGLIATDVLEDIDESSESLDCVTIARKKRVSFSERLVQERSFRPNSSILGQKKKNQRKSRNKLKKKASEEASTDEEGKLGSEDGRDTSRDSVCDGQEKTNAVMNLIEDNHIADDASETEEAISEASVPPKASAVRQRVLRSSTGEETCVTFMVGDGKLERHSSKELSPEPTWLRLLKNRSQEAASAASGMSAQSIVEVAVRTKQ